MITETILIVDDLPENIKIAGNILRSNNYKVIFALNAAEAEERLNNVDIDLILLDVMMPGMDGFEFCRQIKKNPRTRDIPVIFLSALSDTDNIVKAFEVGGMDFVMKPFKVQELLARVKTHLEIVSHRKTIIELEQKNTIAAMIVTANHEINQPLTVLKGNLEMLKINLKDHELPPKAAKNIEKIQKCSELIEAILHKYQNYTEYNFKPYLNDVKMINFTESSVEE